ncbi:MAG: tetratricopeptide repeat protein [Aestuariibaculum sp.]
MNRICIVFIVLILFKTEAQPSVLLVADSLFAHGNYSKAITLYKADSLNLGTSKKIAQAFEYIGNYDEALRFYKKSSKENPDDLLVQYRYAKLLYNTKKYRLAKTELEALIAKDTLNPNYPYQLGLIKESIKDSSAIYDFKKTFRLDATHQKAIYRLGKYHLQKKQHDSVLYYADIGLLSYKNNTGLMSLKGQSYYMVRDFDLAIIWFEKLLDLGESSLFVYEMLGQSYSEYLNYPKAIYYYKEAIRIKPEKAVNLLRLATIYTKAKNYTEAVSCIQKAIAEQEYMLDKEYAQLGAVLKLQKKYKEAIEAFQNAVKENTENHLAHFYLLEAKMNNTDAIDEKIDLCEAFVKNYSQNDFVPFVEQILARLKKEKFMNGE